MRQVGENNQKQGERERKKDRGWEKEGNIKGQSVRKIFCKIQFQPAEYYY